MTWWAERPPRRGNRRRPDRRRPRHELADGLINWRAGSGAEPRRELDLDEDARARDAADLRIIDRAIAFGDDGLGYLSDAAHPKGRQLHAVGQPGRAQRPDRRSQLTALLVGGATQRPGTSRGASRISLVGHGSALDISHGG